MRKLPIALLLLVVATACGLDPEEDTWEYYEDWRNTNNAWLDEQMARTNADGTPYYEKVVPVYDPSAYVLIHYCTDRSLTSGNLSPLVTSTVDVKYRMETCDGVARDSSYLRTTPADSVLRIKFSEVISGFRIALMDMHVGDSCDVVIPYQQAYNNMSQGSVLPYSHLRYDLKLVDIYSYEK